MMTRRISRIAAAFAVIATIGTTSLRADIVDRPDALTTTSVTDDGVTVRVMNNHPDRAYVYVVDGDQLYLLGTVGNKQLKTFEVPEAWVDGTSTVQLKVFPRALEAGIGRSGFTQFGIKTRAIEVPANRLLELLLEPALEKSDLNIVPTL